jgi:hypothetical protein
MALLRATRDVQSPADETVFRSGSDLVLVPASVTDERGRFVDNLTRDDFLLKEDDSRRPIDQFTAQRVPISVGIVMDASGSMTGKRGQNVRKALIVLSDGNDNEKSPVPLRFGTGSTRDDGLTLRRLRAAVGQAQRSDTVVYAVGIGPRTGNVQEAPIDVAKLRQLTDPTGAIRRSLLRARSRSRRVINGTG